MKYMMLDNDQRTQLLQSLTDMPAFLAGVFAGLSDEAARTRGADGSESPVEQVWHLADLEREGFAIRIRRLLTEADPYLPDFDGGKVAAARDYRARSLQEGLALFADARRSNLAALRALEAQEWLRAGTQEGVGRVSLCDIPSFMSQHDAAHRSEIETWRQQGRP